MELLYLYLDDYKNFKKEAFSFTTQFTIHTKITDNVIELQIGFNSDYIPNFFGSSSIANVTGIIGQNGAGKSNLLDFIRNALPDGSGGFREECIVIAKEHISPGHEYVRVFYTPLLEVQIKDTTGMASITKLKERESTGPITINYSIGPFSNTDFAYYSNIVDLRIPSNFTATKIEGEDEPGSTTRFRNISTLALIHGDREAYSNSQRTQIDKIDAYKAREIIRNVEFIGSEHKKQLDFNFPKEILIYLMMQDESSLLNNTKNRWLVDALEFYKNEFEYKGPSDKYAFGNNFLKALLLNFARTMIEFSNINFNTAYIERPNKPKDFVQFFLLTLKKIKATPSTRDNFRQRADAMSELADFVLEYLIKNDEAKIRTYEEPVLRLELNDEGIFNTSRFVQNYVRAKSITDFLNFKFRNLSAGEQSQLTLFSRFFRLSQTLSTDNSKADLLILLDEPDVYFHPEWQRKTLEQLVTYLPGLFPSRRLQLIITSNTSYLASDLPRQNIILIKGTMHDAHSVPIAPMSSQTFGANIHTLLSDSFFVTNFMGEFAKIRIEQLIDFLQNQETTYHFEERDAQLIINWIGEPIIRDRLQELFNIHFNKPTEDLLKRREELQKELSLIEQLLKENNNEKSN